MPEQPPRAGAVLLLSDWRVVVQAKPEIGTRKLTIENVRITSEGHEHRLGNRLEQWLVCENETAELSLIFRRRPIVFGLERLGALLRDVEGAPAPQPALDQIGVDVAGLLDWEITLADGTVARGAEAHLVGEGRRREQVDHRLVHGV